MTKPSLLDRVVDRLVGVGWSVFQRSNGRVGLISSRSARRVFLEMRPDGSLAQGGDVKLDLSAVTEDALSQQPDSGSGACPSCGGLLVASGKFCSTCGAAVDPMPESAATYTARTQSQSAWYYRLPAWAWVFGAIGAIVLIGFIGDAFGAWSGGGSGTGHGQLSASDYSNTVQVELAKLSGSITKFSTLAQNPQPGNASWNNQMQSEFNLWHATYLEAIGLQPPSCLLAVHEKWKGALGQLDQAASEGSDGVSRQDTPTILRAKVDLDRFTAALPNVNSSLRSASC